MPSEVKNGTPEGLCLGEDGGKAKDYRQACKYGKDCYQKNPMHHQKFRHPEAGEAAKEPASKEAVASPGQEEEEELKNDSSPAAKRQKLNVVEKKPDSVLSSTDAAFCDGDRMSTADLLKLSNEERVERVYKMRMPGDFYAFWEFCHEQNRDDPWAALVKTCGLRLVGPFELLLTHEKKKSWIFDEESVLVNDIVCHSRYYHDPPEMQTVLASVDPPDVDTLHFGYFRDGPEESPAFVAHAGGLRKDETFAVGLSSFARLHPLGDNLFGALYHHVQRAILKADPFRQTALQKLKEQLHVHATLKNQDSDFSLEAKTPRMKARDKRKVCQSLHGAGIVVPYNKDTQVGYREVPESAQDLKKMFRNVVEADRGQDEDRKNRTMDALQELLTNVQFANDEGDPGMGLELGIDAFVYGGKALNSSIRHLLSVTYQLLNRETFGEIAMAHLLRRDEDRPVFRADRQRQGGEAVDN